jgi:hypothetical protein
MSESTLGFFKSVAKRNWWILIIAAVVAALVAGLPVLREPKVYTATARLIPDTVTIAQNPRLPGLDTMIGKMQNAEFVDRVAKAAGVQPSDVALTVYSTGNPPNRLNVAAKAANSQLADKVAKAAGDEALLVARESATLEIQSIKDTVSLAEDAIGSIESAPDSRNSGAIYSVYALRNGLSQAEKNLQYIDNVYQLGSEIAMGTSDPKAAAVKAAVAGAFVGLFLGLALVAVRIIPEIRSRQGNS